MKQGPGSNGFLQNAAALCKGCQSAETGKEYLDTPESRQSKARGLMRQKPASSPLFLKPGCLGSFQLGTPWTIPDNLCDDAQREISEGCHERRQLSIRKNDK